MRSQQSDRQHLDRGPQKPMSALLITLNFRAQKATEGANSRIARNREILPADGAFSAFTTVVNAGCH